MLIEVSKEEYRKHFSTDSSPFITEQFVELVENKQDKILRLMKDDNPSIGLLAGIKMGLCDLLFQPPRLAGSIISMSICCCVWSMYSFLS